jgi:hypothetical protein
MKKVEEVGRENIPKLMAEFQVCIDQTRIEINSLLG